MNEEQTSSTMINLYPSPAISKNGNAIAIAVKKLSELIKIAQNKAYRIKPKVVYDNITGLERLEKISTANELQRIVAETFKGLVIVDTLLKNTCNKSTEVVATVRLLTSEGYIDFLSRSASVVVDVGGCSSLLTAESKAIKRALRDLGLIAENENYNEDDHDQPLTDPTINQQDNGVNNESSSELEKPIKTKKTKSSAKLLNKNKNNKVDDSKAMNDTIGEQEKNVDLMTLDRSSISYIEDLENAIKEVKTHKYKNLAMSKFIRQVLGAQSATRLASCSVEDMEKLYEHYVTNKDELL